jgi:hypothetical protein
MSNKVTFVKTLGAASATSIAASQTPGTSALTINGSAATNGVATIDAVTSTNTGLAIGRRVLMTSGSNDTGINFVVTGTNSTGTIITDTFAGGNPTAYSNLDFVTVTSITSTGAGPGSTVSAGTNGVGSSWWYRLNERGFPPMNVGIACELVTGSVNYTVQYTFDDPNGTSNGITYPIPFSLATMTGQTATLDGTIVTPVVCVRVLINSGTGTLRVRFLQQSVA